MENPDFQRIKLQNGPILLFEKRELPIVTIVAAVPFGSAYEHPKLKGIAHFIEHMAFKGTKNRTLREIKESIEKVGGILNAFTAREMTAFWAKLPSRYVERGIDVISDIMLNPLFNEKEMEKERKVILEELKMFHDDPFIFAVDKAQELLYEKPFGTHIGGTQETVSKIKREDILKCYNSNYHPKNMIISVVGNAAFDSVLQFVNEKFERKQEAKELEKPKIEPKHGQFTEKRKNISQASVALSFYAPPSSSKLKYAAEVFNTVLGVGMSSRLWNEIREKRGLAYRAKSFLEQERSYGHIVIYVGTMKEKVKQVKELILKELKKMQQLKSKELEEAKEQLIGLYELGSEESDNVAQNLFMEELAGNAENFYKYPELVSAIKLEDVRKIAKIKNYSFAALIPD